MRNLKTGKLVKENKEARKIKFERILYKLSLRNQRFQELT